MARLHEEANDLAWAFNSSQPDGFIDRLTNDGERIILCPFHI
jgi:hypothetical protein